MQAAFLRVKLKYLDADIDQRRKVAQSYFNGMENPLIKLPGCENCEQHVFHQFVIQTQQRDKVQKLLFDGGVQTMIHYPVPPYRQNAYQGFFNDKYPKTDKIHNEVLSLPMNPVLKDKEVIEIIRVINEI